MITMLASASAHSGCVCHWLELNHVQTRSSRLVRHWWQVAIASASWRMHHLHPFGNTMTLQAVLVLTSTIAACIAQAEQQAQCDIFMAPSKIRGGGYGVFAGRNFEQGEIVELAPLFLPLTKSSPILLNTVLNDYHYGYTRGDDESLGVVALGAVMFYNHNEHPNLLWTTNIGRGEPSESDPDAVGSAVYIARRTIKEGEELFSSYGLEDGGAAWFEARNITMAPPDSIANSDIPVEELEDYRKLYCSKSFAGVGANTYNDRIRGDTKGHKFIPTHISKQDAPIAIANVPIHTDDRIEMAPALLLSKETTKGTALAPLGIYWQDLKEQHRAALKRLRNEGKLKIQHQDHGTDWHRIDSFDTFDNVVIFPAAGTVALMDRVGPNQEPNCRLEIKSSGSDSGLMLEVIATQGIAAGDTLRLNIPPSGTREEKLSFLEILEATGQPRSHDLEKVKATTGLKQGLDEL